MTLEIQETQTSFEELYHYFEAVPAASTPTQIFYEVQKIVYSNTEVGKRLESLNPKASLLMLHWEEITENCQRVHAIAIWILFDRGLSIRQGHPMDSRFLNRLLEIITVDKVFVKIVPERILEDLFTEAIAQQNTKALKNLLEVQRLGSTDLNTWIKVSLVKNNPDALSLLLQNKRLYKVEEGVLGEIIIQLEAHQTTLLQHVMQYALRKLDVNLLRLFLKYSKYKFTEHFPSAEGITRRDFAKICTIAAPKDFQEAIAHLPHSIACALLAKMIKHIDAERIKILLAHLQLNVTQLDALIQYGLKGSLNLDILFTISATSLNPDDHESTDLRIMEHSLKKQEIETHPYRDRFFEILVYYLEKRGNDFIDRMSHYSRVAIALLYIPNLNELIARKNLSLFDILIDSLLHVREDTVEQLFAFLTPENLKRSFFNEKNVFILWELRTFVISEGRETILHLLLDKCLELKILEPGKCDTCVKQIIAEISMNDFFARLFSLLSEEAKVEWLTKEPSLYQIAKSNCRKMYDLVSPYIHDGNRTDLMKKRHKIDGITFFDIVSQKNLGIYKKIFFSTSVEELLECSKAFLLSYEAISFFVGIYEKFLPLVTVDNYFLVFKMALINDNVDAVHRILSKFPLTENEAKECIDGYLKRNQYTFAIIVSLLQQISKYDNKEFETELVTLLLKHNRLSEITEYMSEKLRRENGTEYVKYFIESPLLVDLIYDAGNPKIEAYIKSLESTCSDELKRKLLPFWDINWILYLAHSIPEHIRYECMDRLVLFGKELKPIPNWIEVNIKTLINEIESNQETAVYFWPKLAQFIALIRAEDIAAATPEIRTLLIRYLPYFPLSKVKVLVPLLKTRHLNIFLKSLSLDLQSKYLKFATITQKKSFLTIVGLKNKAVKNWVEEKEQLMARLESLHTTFSAEGYRMLQDDFNTHKALIHGEANQKLLLERLKEALGEGSSIILDSYNAFKTYMESSIAEVKAVEEALTALNPDTEPEEFQDPYLCILMTDPVIVTDDKGVEFIVDRKTLPLLKNQNPASRVPFDDKNIRPHTALKERIERWVAEHE